ncbi:uncharacterized protein LOC123535234 [Mercenaria mercenaria]|uniref:uncharacterized protein LOC123535234 n=1 Tax=Mercenaria mercenaria TaxID=6596 RepID=UPI00234FB2B4|nr:uncharacterized protein LOC123535234 [Mercenaria mercenaria]
MNLIVYVTIIGLAHASSTPSPQNVKVASSQPLPAITGSTTQPLPVVTGSTTQPLPEVTGNINKQSSVTTARKDGIPEISTTAPFATISTSNKNSDNSNALESGILGIIGTQDAVNLEVKAIADIPHGGLSNTKESGNAVPAEVAENPGKDSNDIVLIDHASGQVEVLTTVNSDNGISNASVDAVTANKQNINNSTPTETAEIPKEVKISAKEKKITDPSSDNIINPAINSVSDKKVAGSDMPSELITDQSLNDVKVKDQSITIKTGTQGNNMRLVNVAPETVHGNDPKSTQEVNKNNRKVDKHSKDGHSQKSDPMVNEDVAMNKVLVTGDINLDTNKADKTTNCNVKNSKCVPTRAELVAAGVDNVDLMQHAVDLKSPKFILDTSKTAEANGNKAGENNNCNVKNSKCVPTREELVAAGVDNVDLMQHAIDIKPPKFILDKLSTSKTAEANGNTAGENKNCNVKNSKCVPTREELVAAGVDNVDLMQHAVDLKPSKFNSNKPSSSKTAETNSNKPSTGCNVKNSTCVPSEKEPIAAGMDMNVPMQFSIDTENAFLGQLKQSEPDVVDTNTAKALNIVDSTNTGISMTSSSENKDKRAGNAPTFKTSADEITKVMQPATIQQIPEPSQTTQPTKSAELTTASNALQTSTAISAKMTSAAEQTTSATTEFQTCPSIKCQETCAYGRKVNSNGCETCECKFSNNCPRVSTASRLLCLLRARTDQNCASNADCRRNRICCPGACGPVCRRASRRSSMFLSMLVD